MTFRQLKRIMALVEPYIEGDGSGSIGAGNDELYIYVKPLPERIAEKLEALDVNMESGILTAGGTLTLFL